MSRQREASTASSEDYLKIGHKVVWLASSWLLKV